MNAEPGWLADAPPIEEEAADVPPIRTLPGGWTADDMDEVDEGTPLVGVDLATFLADHAPVPWTIPGVIVDGGLAKCVGKPETFKTFALVQAGLCLAAGVPWLGIELGEPRPFVYLAAEKSRATVRDRFARMSRALPPRAPVRIVHRAGVTFGDRASWARVVELIEALGPRTFVVVDTLASVAGAGFDENNGKDMATVLASARQLTDTGATVALLHHPAKHGDNGGGRGHGSLDGDVDGGLEFTRPDRAIDAGLVRVEPKDGELQLIRFAWDRATFLVNVDSQARILTATGAAAVVDALYDGQGISAERIAAEFPDHGRSILRERIAEAVGARLVARIGRGPATRYIPMPAVGRVDDRHSLTSRVDDPERPSWTTTSGGSSARTPESERESSGGSSNRPPIVHRHAIGEESSATAGGLYTPVVDDPWPRSSADDEHDADPMDQL